MKYKVKFTEVVEYEVEFDTANPIEEEEWENDEWFCSLLANKPDWEAEGEMSVETRNLHKYEVLFCEACELHRPDDTFFSGVPGIRAKLTGGKTDEPSLVVPCCVCNRYSHVQAQNILREAGILIAKE